MANFPTSLDSYTANVDNVDIIYAADVNELQEAVVALETKVGANSSAVTTTHDYKLGEILTTDKAVGKTATQTLTNKTLTSPVINVGSDATGDIYYRNAGALTRLPIGTDNYILKINGTVPNWEAETATVNASETVAGIVEEATTAQTTAGTATGETGAKLFITPAKLAASTPVFNGSGLTNTVQGFISADATNSSAVTSTVTETTVATVAIPANTLGTNKLLKVRAHFVSTWTGDGNSITYRFKYGGTTLCSFVIDPTGTPTETMTAIMEAQIQGAGTTSSQECSGTFVQSGEASGATPVIQPSAIATSAIDSTTSQNLIITVQNGASGATLTTTMHNYSVQKIV